MEHFKWDKVVDFVQSALVWFVIILTTICTGTLILFDTLAGTGVMEFLTNGKIVVSVLISLATTGLLMALTFIGYSLLEKKMSKVGWAVLAASFGVYCLDVVFDSYTADVLRFGEILPLAQIANPNIHMMYRILIGGISTVGEPMGIALIAGMPVLKKLINDALPVQNRSYNSNTHRPHYPQNQQVMNKLPQRHQQPVRQAVSPMPEPPDGFDELAESFNRSVN
jgi:hypothetical protein